MKIAIASGKGGTGKTTVAVNLALAAQGNVQLLDCDVEEPNAHIFLKAEKEREREVCILIPEIIEAKCIADEGCNICSEFCEFNAIACLGNFPVIMPDMCHGCGGCKRICPKKAIREVPQRIGTVTTFRHDRLSLIEGRLDIGMSLAPTLIKSLKEDIKKDALAILDAPPGTSCPVAEAVQGCDFVVLVTEPTPFGLNDLKLAVEMVRELRVKFGVVINRSDPDYKNINEYCAKEQIHILAEIPEDRQIAQAYAHGIPMLQALPDYLPFFRNLLHRIEAMA